MSVVPEQDTIQGHNITMIQKGFQGMCYLEDKVRDRAAIVMSVLLV